MSTDIRFIYKAQNGISKHTFNFRYVFFMVLLGGFYLHAISQEPNTSRQLFNIISKVCSNYQLLPLHLEVEITNSSNYFTSLQDTLTVQGELDLSDRGSYVRLNNQEQLVNDSSMLMIDNRYKRLLLYFEKNLHTGDQLKRFQQTMFGDSSIKAMATQYSVTASDAAQDLSSITLISKTLIGNTTVPAREITIQYVKSRLEPVSVKQTERLLYPLSPNMYDSLSHNPIYQHYVLKTKENNVCFFIKEQTTVSKFKKILHQEVLPRLMEDYLKKGENSQYIPKDLYSDYQLTVMNPIN